MTTITVRDVPDDVRDELAARAARSGRSLQEFLKRSLIDLASTPDLIDVVREVRQQARHYPPVGAKSIIADVAADRR